MQIDGIGFNQEWAKKKSEDAFVAEFSTAEMGHIYPDLSAGEKEEALRKAHQLLNAPEEPAKEAA
jgi:hypothetical protein